MISAGDIDAAADVLNDLLAEVHDFDAPTAIGYLAHLDALGKKVNDALSELRTRALTAMDGQPVKVADKVWVAKPTGKWRPNHNEIKKLIALAAERHMTREAKVTPATLVKMRAAINATVNLCWKLYVSPATLPKTTELEALGYDFKDVAQWERGVPKLTSVDVGEQDDDA